MSSRSSEAPTPQQPPDRISEIMDCLNDPTLDNLPDHLRMKYTEGFDPDNLEQELENHPFFMTQLPDPSKPLPPLLEAFQQLKYSETDNTHHELACNHKEDGTYHFKIKKYRIASTCFTTAISHELKENPPDDKFLSQLYNNRSACMWYLQNYRSCVNDCKLALKHDPTYFKAFKRCVQALAELEKWDDVETMCVGWVTDDPDQFSFISDMRVKARKGNVVKRVSERKLGIAVKSLADKRAQLLDVVKSRGIKMRDEKFLECSAADNGRVVSLSDDGEGGIELKWPVLFMYPQYSQTDLVEAFSENHQFSAHLTEMLDGDNSPPWDADKEYCSSSVDVYYLCDKLVRVDTSSTLLEVMTTQSYILPGNGVPSFFVFAKGNQFCADFIERVQIGE